MARQSGSKKKLTVVPAGKRSLAVPPEYPFSVVKTGALKKLMVGVEKLSKVTSIVAPTGYGKSVLFAQLHQQFSTSPDTQTIWVSLDDRDLTIDRVLSRLERAIGVESGEFSPPQALLSGDEPMESRIDDLLERVAALPGPTVIFIDNLSFCGDETLGHLMDRLVFLTPGAVKFLLCSTVPIPLNVARAKLEGRIQELRFPDLGLKRDEVAAMLGKPLARKVGAEGLDTIIRRTEGWPAAVRLAQILLSSSDEPAEVLRTFSGADQDIAGLLNRQLLEGLDTAARQFLLKLSLLRIFSVELCDFTMPGENAAEQLEELIARNMFVIPMDRNRSVYRLHGMFREYLMGEAQRELSIESRGQILARACEWSEKAGDWQEAMDYAISSGDAELACNTLERVAPLFVRDRGDLRQFISWVEVLRNDGCVVGREAEFWYVWALVFHRRYDFARKQCELLIERIGNESFEGDEKSRLGFNRRLKVIQICIDTYTDQIVESGEAAAQWLSKPEPGDDPFNVATIASANIIALSAKHEFVEARSFARSAQAAIAQTHSAYGVGWVSLLNAVVSLQEGDYAAVHNELISSISRLKSELGEGSSIAGTTALIAAKSAVEMGKDDEARELLTRGYRHAQTHGVVDTAALGLDAALKLWPGHDDHVVELAKLRDIGSSYPPRLSLMLSCMLVSRLVRLGRNDEAIEEAAHFGLVAGASAKRRVKPEGVSVPSARDYYVFAEIDLLIATGQFRLAEVLIKSETDLARSSGRFGRLVELALAEMMVAVCSHNPQPAVRHLVRAVGYAARRRIYRPFRDRAEILGGLVNDTKPQAWDFALEEERKFFAEICRDLPNSNRALLEQLDELDSPSALLETPTARELELLKLIEAGLSNQQLADRLNVSVATVKWHLYNLYTKLSVSSRSAAIARARALNLLSR